VADTLPPVAIRVARPFATEEELLENELETLTRTSITLLGAPSRPPGLVLRFELVLASGHVLVRGEGRVVGYKPDAHFGTGGLTLRFTRLDTRSKALVDRAAALRDRRRPSALPAVAESLSMPAPPITLEDERLEPEANQPLALSPPQSRSSMPPAAAPPAPPTTTADGVRPPNNDRDALLERLRARSRALGEVLRLLPDRRR
jgi:hypothetical protein